MLNVYVFHGLGGITFSSGMDQLVTKLNAVPGIKATIHDYETWKTVLEEATAASRRNEKIMFVGHSFGANALLLLCAALNRRGIIVPQIVTYDPSIFPSPVLQTAGVPNVTHNVLAGLNFYQMVDMVGHGKLQRPAVSDEDPEKYRGLTNTLYNVPHTWIDKMPELHTQTVSVAKKLL